MGKTKFVKCDTTAVSAASDAWSGMEGLKEELESWYENLHENFQNGQKGEELQEAIQQIDAASEPSAPYSAEEINISYDAPTGTKQSRSTQCSGHVNAMTAAAEGARSRVEELNQLEYTDDGVLLIDGKPVTDETDTSEPRNEDERDSIVSELEEFADECEGCASEWEQVSFPGMY